MQLLSYYPVESQCSYSEFALCKETSITSNSSLQETLVSGYNGGYIECEHLGFNHYLLLPERTHRLAVNTEINACVTYSQQVDANSALHADDTSPGDFFWWGVDLSWYFN